MLTHSTSTNLFGQHPPFQMDANFGTTAGIAEMFLQSHTGVIQLLPALPREWSTGEIKGLKARGNFTVDIKWADGAVTETTIVAESGGTLRVQNPFGQTGFKSSHEYREENGVLVFEGLTDQAGVSLIKTKDLRPKT